MKVPRNLKAAKTRLTFSGSRSGVTPSSEKVHGNVVDRRGMTPRTVKGGDTEPLPGNLQRLYSPEVLKAAIAKAQAKKKRPSTFKGVM